MIPILDAAGKVVQYAVSPLKVELRRRDIMQIIVGSSIIAVPLGFTEETWNLGETLPAGNIIALAILSILLVSIYVYFNFYRHMLREHWADYVKRVIVIYVITLVIVGTLLTIIQRAPWDEDLALAFKRTVIVAFPASMSAAVSDSID